MSSRAYSIATGALTLLLLFDAGASSGQGLSGLRQDELQALPRVCLAQRFINQDLETPMVPANEREQWASTLGPSYKHYHHFCWGLVYMRRAAANPSKGKFNYDSAVNNFQYVIRNSDRGFALLPEVHLRKGMALRLLGDDAASASEFVKAVRLKRDYSPAYAALVQLHVDLGDNESARKVLETGLKNAPNSKLLAQKMVELDRLDIRD